MKITLDVVKEAAKELNESFSPEPPIKINTKSTIASLTEEIRATIEILEKGDVISEKMADVLSELEIDVPAAVKVGEAKKKPAEKKVASKKEPKGPGVISSIHEILMQKKPVSKEQIVAFLKKRFPEKEEKSMLNTIKVQLPGRMSNEKGIKIQVTEDGKYFVK